MVEAPSYVIYSIIYLKIYEKSDKLHDSCNEKETYK